VRGSDWLRLRPRGSTPQRSDKQSTTRPQHLDMNILCLRRKQRSESRQTPSHYLQTCTCASLASLSSGPTKQRPHVPPHAPHKRRIYPSISHDYHSLQTLILQHNPSLPKARRRAALTHAFASFGSQRGVIGSSLTPLT
jgi:hypothetical protein